MSAVFAMSATSPVYLRLKIAALQRPIERLAIKEVNRLVGRLRRQDVHLIEVSVEQCHAM
jgi:hypothetical protein